MVPVLQIPDSLQSPTGNQRADIKKIKGLAGDTFKLVSHFIVSFSGNKLSESNAAKSICQALEKSSALAKSGYEIICILFFNHSTTFQSLTAKNV